MINSKKWQNKNTWKPGSRGGQIHGRPASFCDNLSAMQRELENRITVHGEKSQIVQDQKVHIKELIASFNCDFCHNTGLEMAETICKFCLDGRLLLYKLGYIQ